MKTDTKISDGSYINDALKCSTLDISSKDDTNGQLKGSNEYICKLISINMFM